MPLVLALCAAASPHAAGADAVAGKAAFAACASCHPVGPSAHSAFGPQLNGVLGRKAGTLTDYAYSAAMKNSGIVWSETALAAFVRAPEKLVPGTKMRFFSFGYGEREIADLTAYLKTLKSGESP